MALLAVSGPLATQPPQVEVTYRDPHTLLGVAGQSCHLSTATHLNNSIALIDGFFFNHQTLSALWETPMSDGAASLALAGYERLGRDFLGHLDGGFSLILYDPDKEQLIFARDHIGQRPLFFYQQASNCIVSSSLNTLRAATTTSPLLNCGMLAEFLLQAQHTPAETLFEGVYRAQPGRVYTWRAGTLSDSAIWQPHFASPIAEPKNDADRERVFQDSADAITSAMSEAINSLTVPTRSTAVSLSGGLDSSGVAALAAKTLNPILLSVLFEEESAKETDYINSVRTHLGLPFADIILSSPPKDWIRSQIQQSEDFPVEPNGWLTHLVRVCAKTHSCDHLLTGYGADELCTGFGGLELDRKIGRTNRTLLLPLLGGPLIQSGKKSLARSPLARGLKQLLPRYRWFPTWCTKEFYRSTAIESRLAAPQEEIQGCEFSQAQLWRLLMNPYAQYVRDSEHREAARDGIQLIHPFFSKPVVDILASLPASIVARNGEKKALLRRALTSALPSKILSRPDKAEFSFMWTNLLADHLSNPPSLTNLKRRKWIDPAVVQAQFTEAARGAGRVTPQQKQRLYQLWNILVVEEILDHFGG